MPNPTPRSDGEERDPRCYANPEPGHLPECYIKPFAVLVDEIAAAGHDVSDAPEPTEGAGFVCCAEGCPHLARIIERGQELAKEHGW